MVFLGNVELEVAAWHWGSSVVALVVGVKPVDGEAWELEILFEKVPAGKIPECGEVVYVMYVKAGGFETSASALFVSVEAEAVEVQHLRIAVAVDLPAGEEVEASHSKDVAECSGDAEVEDVVALRSEAASVVGLLEGVEAVDVGTVCFGDAVGLLVGVEVEHVEALCLEDAVERFEDAEAEEGDSGLPEDAEEHSEDFELGEGAVERPEDAEVEDDAAEHSEDLELEEHAVERPEDAGVEGAAASHLEASAVKTLVVVEATQVFGLAFGSFECSPDLGLACCLEDSYSLSSQEKGPLLEM